jgi:UDP-3-O-[3-hydroxymyristoyl] glucosamine N-acyltransferase
VEISLNEIADRTGGKIYGDGSVIITGVSSLENARPGCLSFFTDRRLEDAASATQASALIVAKPTPVFEGPQLAAENPLLAFAKTATVFAAPPKAFPGISEAASVDPTAELGAEVSIYPGVFVCAGARVGDRTILYPGVFVGENASIGSDTVVYPNVSIMKDVAVGDRVILHAGVVLGADGFGFVRDGASSFKIPQLGTVRIEDEVEIGANSCIDRAALGETVVGRGVKMDNLIQVGHNVTIGEGSIVVAQAGISGSVRIGRNVVMGGQVGVADHLEIGDRAMVGSQSGIIKSVAPGEAVSGTPAIAHRRWLRSASLTARLPELVERLKRLELALDELRETLQHDGLET